jgi:hypothetical protein
MDGSGAVTVAVGTEASGHGVLAMPKRDGDSSADLAAADTEPEPPASE